MEFYETFIRSANEAESADAQVRAKIAQLNSKLGAEDVWYAEVLQCIWLESVSEFRAIERDFLNPHDRDVSLLAWRARNLHELVVWCMYVKSPENAQRLRADARRDVRDIAQAYRNWGQSTDQPQDWLDGPQRVIDGVNAQAQSVGIESLDGQYQKVHNAAAACRFDANFKVANKLYSKFAHPTAMMVLGVLEEESLSRWREVIYGKACISFRGIFEVLDGHLTNSLAALS